MNNKTYKVFCALCKMEYEQITTSKPYYCGGCGSEWIAVKHIPDKPHCVDCGSELLQNGLCTNQDCFFSEKINYDI